MGKQSSNLVSHHDKFIKKQNYFDLLRDILKYSGWLLVALFGGLQIQQIFAESSPKFNNNFTHILFKIIIALLYSSWVYGLSFDLKDEEYTMLKAPDDGKIRMNSIWVIAFLIITFGVFAFFTKDLKYLSPFVIVLSAFSFLGRFGEISTGKVAMKALKENRKDYIESNDFLGELSINTIEHYILGKWLKYRFYVGTTLIVLMNIITFTKLGEFLSQLMDIPTQLVIVCSIFVYLLIMEVWNWIKRINRKIRLDFIKEIKATYKLIKD